jgi:exonuclease SbcC
MITKVRLKNWKSHLDSEFEFGPGVNALMGIMGSGKSSVMQAISFALFGTFPSHQSKKVSLDELIMSKPQKQKKAEVELEFRLGEDDYYIKRVLEQGKGTTHAEIRKNKTLLDVNPQGVTSEAERVLQMDYELFSKAVYSEQDGIDYFLRLPKGQRMEQIDRMVKLDRFGFARERCVSLRNKVIERRKEKVRFLTEIEKEDFAGRIKETEEEMAGLEKQAGFFAEGLKKAAEEKTSLGRGVNAYEEKETELNGLKVEAGSVAASIRELEEQAREKKARAGGRSAENVMEELDDANEEIVQFRKELEEQAETEKKLTSGIAEANTKIMLLTKEEVPKLKERLARMEKDHARLKDLTRKLGSEPDKSLREKTRELENVWREACNCEARMAELENGVKQLKGAGVKCPVCDSELERHKKEELLAHKAKAIASLEREGGALGDKSSKLQAAVSELESSSREAALLQERLADYDKTREDLGGSEKKGEGFRKDAAKLVGVVQNMKADMEKARTKLAAREKDLAGLRAAMNDMNDVLNLQKKLSAYSERRKSLETRSKELEESLKKVNIRDLRSLLQRAAGLESEMAAKLSSVKEKAVDRKNVLEDLKKRMAVFEKYQTEARRDEVLAAQLETFTKVLRVTQEELREGFLTNVNTIMNKVWEELYPYGDFSEVRMMVEEGDYVLKLRGADGWINTDGIASGGERSMAVLALRIAFSLAFIPNLRWLILDEPTHNLDSNAIQHFSGVLRDKMDRFAEQVFLITHEDGLAGGITGRLYNLERDKATGQATRIGRLEE